MPVGLEELAADDGSGAAASFLASAAERKKATTTYRVDGLNSLTPVADRYIPKVGDTRFDTFLQEAYGRYLTWLGVEPYASETLPGTPARSARLGQCQTNAIERIVDGPRRALRGASSRSRHTRRPASSSSTAASG
ncbi:hypothetical protein H5392_04790 [Tessaracoccus sp. MC1865]|uniref:hypothetical protein n=1 Tax=Tessaracoccus sp. MC1865 TaxID=2760310 RepID=UPI001601E6EB|nr:hypothetical protein [Tessaracoccus sp. MC1865]MBB1483179.1 hypothetical protein [Tessaracoccus sp. MC1865]QTO37399.1 hypothetical protein J7D54_13425 [Tessaracoccus sp. MC1865]